MTRDSLFEMSRKELMSVLRDGYAVDPASLDDTEYKGVSLGLPGFVERLTWKTFKKVFHRDRRSGVLRGWNVRLRQTGIDGSCEPLVRGGEPVTFGHYEVVPAEGRFRGSFRPGVLLIDYGLGKNAALDPMALMRDPIVAVREGESELLLGWSYVDLGFTQIGTPSFFTLERDGPLTHRKDPPRG